MRKALVIIAVLFAVVLVFGCVGAVAVSMVRNADQAYDGEGAPITLEEPTKESPASPSKVDDGSRGDGMWEVGVMLAAGQWQTTAPADGFGCYWARKKDASGQVESIIANGFVAKGSPGIVKIAALDKFVEFSGGCRWVRVA